MVATLNCATSGSGHRVFVVDGQVVKDLGSGVVRLELVWTPPIGPGTHIVALSRVCPQGLGNNPADDYIIDGDTNPTGVRVEVLKVP
jgi:hypothetical protein